MLGFGARRELREVKNEAQRERWQAEFLEESLRALEDHAREDGWRRLTSSMEFDFTRDGLDDLMAISQAMYISHPLIQRAVNVRSYYTWGQGVTITVADERVNERWLRPMLDEPGNQSTLFSHMAHILTDVDQQVDGNTLIAMFTDPRTGLVKLRDVPVNEIREIITNPDDVTEIWYYRRRWTQRSLNMSSGTVDQRAMEAFYPDFRYASTARQRPESIGGIEVRWDSPIVHQKTGGRKRMLFGIPETYAALDWARAYRKFLEDWHTIVSSLARFAWRATVSANRVQAAKDKFATSDGRGVRTRQPPPPAGSVFIGGQLDRLDPIAKSGTTTSAEDARPSRLMVGAAMDLPDTILSGDADVGNFATARTLDRPTELAIMSRQQMWIAHHRSILDYSIEQAIRARIIPDADPGLSISFPDILEHDIEAQIRAVISAATLDGKVEAGTIPRDTLIRLLMEALGVDDIDEKIKQLDDEDHAALAQAVRDLAKAVNGEPDPAPQGPPPQFRARRTADDGDTDDDPEDDE